MDKVRRYFAMAGALLGGVGAFYLIAPLENLLKQEFTVYVSAGVIVFAAAVLAVAFFFIGAPVSRAIVGGVDWLAKSVVGASLQDIVVGAGGLIVGLIIANLLAPSLARIPIVGVFLPAIAMVILGYIGIAVARSKKEDLVSLSPARLRQAMRGGRTQRQMERKGELPFGQAAPKLLDTSTIIDGRIVDICRSGFIEGKIIIPNFVLDELRRIADSADNLKRNKGRRGLDTLNTLQRDIPLEVLTWDWPTDQSEDVDALLLKMGKATGADVITTDYNLAKIAELQQVGVLNVNQLANALKLMVAPGEELSVEIHREGKQPGQGIGYLDDGTMVVVEQAKRHLNEEIPVVVTNVHTSPAGRMVFARPKYLDKAE
ncbi:MAG: PIN/TRAM domain-containing protein [Bacillota bacterium]